MRLLLTFIVIGLLAGCAGRDRQPHFTETLRTQISIDGTKFFDYFLHADRSRKQGKSTMQGPRKAGSDRSASPRSLTPEEIQERSRKKLYERLGRKLLETGYCREGFVELYSFFDRGNVELRGECREAATVEDRKNFVQSEQ